MPTENKIIIGLGNYPSEYQNTRHNIGFEAIDKICDKLNLKLTKKIQSGVYCVFEVDGVRWILGKPHTFVNLSGDFVVELRRLFPTTDEDIYVICDDLDTKVGEYQFKDNSSTNGHNGLKDIIKKNDMQKLKKIKIGIGRPENKDEVVNYVLGKFSHDELLLISELLDDVVIPFILHSVIRC